MSGTQSFKVPSKEYFRHLALHAPAELEAWIRFSDLSIREKIEAVHALGEEPTSSWCKSIVQGLLTHPNPEIRIAAIEAFDKHFNSHMARSELRTQKQQGAA